MKKVARNILCSCGAIGIIFVNILGIFGTLTMVATTAYSSLEANQVIAATTTDTVVVTLTVDAGIIITSPADTSMSRNLGVAADTAIATTTWNVKTNNALGYALYVKSTSTPAMNSGSNSIPNYQTGSPNTWTVTAASAFGYSAFGTDVPTGTWGTGSTCGAAHVPSATLNYKGFTTSDFSVATRAATTTTAGVDTTICYAVEQDTFYIPSGTYIATIVATAATL
ncbi:MAG TPA: hypothetical protein PLF31_01415 [Candidatus Paceibacterota bacterium]|nr:hypothetical protein [Candidatus Paceibacterota bacterium]